MNGLSLRRKGGAAIRLIRCRGPGRPRLPGMGAGMNPLRIHDSPFIPTDRVNPVPTQAQDHVGTAFRLSGFYGGNTR